MPVSRPFARWCLVAASLLVVVATTHPFSTSLTAASPIVISADATTRIDSTLARANLATQPLRVDATPGIDTLLHFTVAGVGQGAVSKALLWLTVSEGAPSGGIVTLTSSSWSESTVTWQTAPPRGTEVGRFGSVKTGASVSLDVTSAIMADGVYSLRIYSTNSDGASYRNRRQSSGAPRLELTVTAATPAPTPAPTPATPTPSPSPTPTATPSPTPSPSPTASPTPTPSPTASPTPSPTPTAAQTPTPGSGGVPAFDHVFLVVEENKDYGSIIGSASAPYVNSLASQYGLATDYHAITHPSLPNYLALVGGATFGITANCNPSATCTVNAPNLADRIEAAGRTWGAYLESMPTPCKTTDGGGYIVHHDPFVYFDDIRTDAARCSAHVLPFTRLANDLASAATTPDFVFIGPNNCNNMHDCPVATGDVWLQTNLASIFGSPAWTQERSLLVITWDENGGASGNRVATILIGPSVKPGFASTTTATHYSLLRTIESAWGLTPLTAQDAGAQPMSEFFLP